MANLIAAWCLKSFTVKNRYHSSSLQYHLLLDVLRTFFSSYLLSGCFETLLVLCVVVLRQLFSSCLVCSETCSVFVLRVVVV